MLERDKLSTRSMASTAGRDVPLPEPELRQRLDGISDKFTEASEMVNDAVRFFLLLLISFKMRKRRRTIDHEPLRLLLQKESFGTTYFSEDMQEAEELVKAVLESYQVNRPRRNLYANLAIADGPQLASFSF
jgi:hypothetical protein